VLSQEVGKQRPIEMKLRVRFFPEDVRDLADYPSQVSLAAAADKSTVVPLSIRFN